jgi:hypothetical protein
MDRHHTTQQVIQQVEVPVVVSVLKLDLLDLLVLVACHHLIRRATRLVSVLMLVRVVPVEVAFNRHHTNPQ